MAARIIGDVIYISSDEDDDWTRPFNRLFTPENKKNPIRKFNSANFDDEDDDDCEVLDLDECMVLDGDPDERIEVARKDLLTLSGSDDLVVLAEKGQIACRDYPHARHLCVTFPFNTSPHDKYCDLCHCYVCDTRAPCGNWGTGKSSSDHCHSTENEGIWRELRRSSMQVKVAQPLNEPSMHPVGNPSSLAEDVQLREMLQSLGLNCDPPDMQGGRLTGTVKWFNSHSGYGFIIPDGGGEDLFVHCSSVKSQGMPNLAGGETVEFQIETVDHGRNRAINVSGPGGSLIQGDSRRDNACSSGTTGGRGGGTRAGRRYRSDVSIYEVVNRIAALQRRQRYS